MDPTWVATGLKVELDTLVVECKLVSDRIREIISLDGENDNKVTSFAEFSNEFFEDMEFSWKGCVKSIHLKEEFAEVDEAAEALYIVGILGSVGVDHDNDMIEHLLTQVKGKDIMELIAAGREKLAYVPSGGGAVAVASAAAGVGGGAAESAAAELKKEEKVVQKEESDDDMDFGLFD
ncbi:hypothetical protein ACS0TY_028444 [Phlomoides rotata]